MPSTDPGEGGAGPPDDRRGDGTAWAVPRGVPGVLQQGAATHLPAEPGAGGTVLECEEDREMRGRR